jgi:putative flavoprotein involved in K+ transport
MATEQRYDTVIVGAGQAGLAVGYHLAKRGESFVILDASERVGDVWRKRFDSLRLYSPARYDGLPGWGFPAPPWSFPTKDEVGDYLEAYAARFELPVRTGVAVTRLARRGSSYLIETTDGEFEAGQVVVASGTFQEPIVPEFAGDLDPGIRQLHSNDYRNPSQLRDGPVLVVGASHSGGDIAYEVARTHETVLCGKSRGEIPFRIDGRPARVILRVLWFVANHVLTVSNPLGRKVRDAERAHGAPLLRVKQSELAAAGVERTEARMAGVRDGKPLLEDGSLLDVANVIWCTGFGKDVSWIDIPVLGDDGWPEQRRGVVPGSPGLYFIGLPLLHSFGSMLVGGVGRDAGHVAKKIASRRSSAGAPALEPAAATA